MVCAESDSSRSQRNDKVTCADGSGSYGTSFCCTAVLPSGLGFYGGLIVNKWLRKSLVHRCFSHHIGQLRIERYSHNQKCARTTLGKGNPLHVQNFKQYISLSSLNGRRDGPRYGWTYTTKCITNGLAGLLGIWRERNRRLSAKQYANGPLK